jgi:hypothetical protein
LSLPSASLQEARCLHEVARFITGLDLRDEPRLYLWGLSLWDGRLRPWDLLVGSRKRFESSLPVSRPSTEPDAALWLAGKYLILIEAKFTSANTFYASGPRKDKQSLTLEELLEIYRDPDLKILDVERAKSEGLVYYQLWRNLVFSEYMARLDSPRTLAFHANLVRAGYEHESTSHFRQLLKPGFNDRFARITWENLFTLTGLHWRKLARLQEYLLTKTAALVPAFHLDAW